MNGNANTYTIIDQDANTEKQDNMTWQEYTIMGIQTKYSRLDIGKRVVW